MGIEFFRWADLNENILAWGSENIIIPYLNPLDGKVHRYFVDNYIVFKDRNGNKNKFLIEIKPSKQTQRPVKTKYKNKKLFYTNRKCMCRIQQNGKLLMNGLRKKVISF